MYTVEYMPHASKDYFYLKTLLDNFHILTMTFSKWTENKTLPPDFLEGEMRKEDKTAC